MTEPPVATTTATGTVVPSGDAGAPADDVPRLRGVMYVVALAIGLPAFTALWWAAAQGPDRAAVAVYAVAVSVTFAIGVWHHGRRWWRLTASSAALSSRLDHAAVFGKIAGTFTPICVLADPSGAHRWLLIPVWLGALVGIAVAMAGVTSRPVVGFLPYCCLAWPIALSLLVLDGIDATVLALLGVGTACYWVGAAVCLARRPVPVPAIYGYLEIWQTLVVLGSAAYFAAIAYLASSPPPG
jgi:hemolysin III